MALVNPNIAMSFRPTTELQMPNALAQYAQIQQIQGGQRQAEVADMQLESLRRDRDVLGQIQAAIVAKGGPADLAAAADEMIKSGKPEYLTQGMAIRQKLADQAAFAAYQKEFGPKAQNALAPAFGMPAGDQAPGDYTSTQTMGRVPGVVTTPIPESPPMNAMAPAAAPVNAMAGQPDIAGLEARYRRVANIDTPGAKAEAALLLKQIEAASKESRMYTVPGVGLVDSTGRVVKPSAATPTAPPAAVAEYTFAKTPEGGNFKGSFQDFITARAAAGRAPRPEAAPRTQQVTMDDGAIGIMNMDTGAITPATMAGAPVKGKSSKEIAVSEQQASYNLGRILDAAKEINAAIKKDPGALKPGVGEAAAASVGLSGTANVARNAQRQIVFGAQRDALDAMLYLATGAAYNKEQLEGQMAAYVPAFTDKPDAVEAKRTRMLGLIQNAKVRAGKAWTPEMDAASQVLFQPIVSGGKPAASGATGGWSVVK
jgi:hypothetical protein